MIKASQSDAGSFVRSAAYELEQGFKDLKTDLNRQLAWDGTSDLATMSVASVASAQITIAGRESTEPALKFIDVGMIIDIVDSNGSSRSSRCNSSLPFLPAQALALTAVLNLDTAVTAFSR